MIQVAASGRKYFDLATGHEKAGDGSGRRVVGGSREEVQRRGEEEFGRIAD